MVGLCVAGATFEGKDRYLIYSAKAKVCLLQRRRGPSLGLLATHPHCHLPSACLLRR